MTKLSAWGNAHHGKITDGVIELPDLSTHTLKNPPEWGHTRLIKFDDLDPIELTQKQKDDLLEKGLEFNDYAILTDGHLYDKSISNDLWLYRAPDKKVWRIVVDVTAIAAGHVDITLNFTRFGKFNKSIEGIVHPQAVTGAVSFTVQSTNTDNGFAYKRSLLSDVSPNGNNAVIRIKQNYPIGGDKNPEVTFIEISLSGVVDNAGIGLVASGVEFIDSSTGFVAETTTNNTSSSTSGSIYKVTVDNNTNYPPPDPSTPDSTDTLTREKTISYVLGAFNDPSPPGQMVEKFASNSDSSSETVHEFTSIIKVLYDKDNVKHVYSYHVKYRETYIYNKTSSAGGSITYSADYDINYDSSGYIDSWQRTSDSISGSTEYKVQRTEVYTYVLDVQLFRDGVIFSDNHAEKTVDALYANNGAGQPAWRVIDGSAAVFGSWYGGHWWVAGEEASQPHPSGVPSHILLSATDLMGADYSSAGDAYPSQVIMPRIQYYEPIVGRIASGYDQWDVIYAENNYLLDIYPSGPMNNMFSATIGYNLNHADKEQRLIKMKSEIATPEGADNVRYEVPDGEETLTRYYSFNPYSFELVRESPQIVNFI